MPASTSMSCPLNAFSIESIGSRGNLSVFQAKSLPEPAPTIPRGTRDPELRIPLTTSWTDPSPPTIITGEPCLAAIIASSFASPCLVVSTYLACSSFTRSRTKVRYLSILPRFAAGLRITRGLPKNGKVAIVNLLFKLMDFSRLYHFPDIATIIQGHLIIEASEVKRHVISQNKHTRSLELLMVLPIMLARLQIIPL